MAVDRWEPDQPAPLRPQGQGSAGGIPKITAPRVAAVLARERLHQRLDEKFSTAVAVWIGASAGSGKTTLAADYAVRRGLRLLWYRADSGDADPAAFFKYLGAAGEHLADHGTGLELPLLTPEYLAGLATFTRNFCRRLYGALPRACLVVLDDLHEIPAGTPLPELLAVLVDECPAGIRLALLSRSGPPPALARGRIAGRVAVLDEAVLRLTADESAQLACRAGFGERDHEWLAALHRRTAGWVAGQILLQASGDTAATEPLTPETRSLLADYFRAELMSGTDPETDRLLLCTAYPESFTAADARDLAGHPDPGRILECLLHRHCFVECSTGIPVRYHYHPLFREFLTAEAQARLSAPRIAELQRNAGRLAWRDRDIHRAATLLTWAGDWQTLARLLVESAAELLAEGRFRSLAQWLQALPPELRSGQPWLDYWLGMARIFTEPVAARTLLEAAYRRFRQQRDRTGAYTAWTGAVTSVLLANDDFRCLDQWLRRHADLEADLGPPEDPALESATAATIYCVQAHRLRDARDLARSAERALRLAWREGNRARLVQVLFYQVHCELTYASTGALGAALDQLLALSEDASLPVVERLRIHLALAMEYADRGDRAGCQRAVGDGLTLARRSGVRMLDFMLRGHQVWIDLLLGEEPGDGLRRMAVDLPRRGGWDQAFYHHLQGVAAQARGELVDARRAFEHSVELSESVGETGGVRLTRLQLVLLGLQQRQWQDARARLASLERRIRRTSSPALLPECRLARAALALGLGRPDQAMTELTAAACLSGSDPLRNHRIYWPPQLLGPVCHRALESGFHREWVRALIRLRRLPAEPDAVELEHWPWPVSIYTLGRFSMAIDGRALAVTTRSHRKPLELLQALIALGGRDVGEDHLCDALWPDADGDAGRRNLKITLHRLRRLLKADPVQVVAGRLSLSPDHCWVDVWACERLASRLEAAMDPTAEADPEPFAQQVATLYQGAFLSRENDQPWIHPLRERLQERLARTYTELGHWHIARGAPARAINAFHNALRIEPATEPACRGLMRALAGQGDAAGALRAYHALIRALELRLATGPSTATVRLAESLNPGPLSPPPQGDDSAFE